MNLLLLLINLLDLLICTLNMLRKRISLPIQDRRKEGGRGGNVFVFSDIKIKVIQIIFIDSKYPN